MRAVVQRVKETSLKVDGKIISKIPSGLVVFLGVKKGDSKETALKLANKICALRVFEDENGKMNKSVKDVGGQILSVSQFTLYGDVSHGNRPGFSDAEVPELAKPVYEYFSKCLQDNGVITKLGVFGADMKISQINDGPVTIIYEM
ncbi:MAG: D-tyrosyl-tRNA(Tyr) deacylase [Clostridia bacterium]|nr:D-tyrosyl-tRNA(Tyr) deacylase [Clostridia bacterium]